MTGTQPPLMLQTQVLTVKPGVIHVVRLVGEDTIIAPAHFSDELQPSAFHVAIHAVRCAIGRTDTVHTVAYGPPSVIDVCT